MHLYRHDLAFAHWNEDDLLGLGHHGLRDLILAGKVPGIVRRNESQEGVDGSNHYSCNDTVHVGFVYPFKVDGSRVRYASSIDHGRITRKLSPYDVAAMGYIPRTNPLMALSELSAGFALGVWGSASLEIVTGMEYTSDDSDLDVLCEYRGPDAASELSRGICALEREYGMRIDVEMTLPSGYGINLKEYMGDSETLLAKGLRDVILINRKDILESDEPARDGQ